MDEGGPESNTRDASSTWSTDTAPESWNQFKVQTQRQVLQLQRIVADLKNSTSRDRAKYEELQREIRSSKDVLKSAETRLTSLQKFVASQSDSSMATKKQSTDAHNEAKNLAAALEIEINGLKTNLEVMNRSVQQIRVSSGGAAAASAIPGNISQLFEALERQLTMYDAKIAEMDVRFEVVEATSYNGRLIWKITDFTRRKDDAKRGKTLSTYSQPFYSSRYGYKMCLRIYLNGDGMGKNTHISLFFVLMKGEYDSLLPFPFRQKVTLMILDQGRERRHLTDVFRPDPSSSSFSRPVSDMNIASGCPMFVSHETVINSSYLKEETIFIKCVVDTSDLENY